MTIGELITYPRRWWPWRHTDRCPDEDLEACIADQEDRIAALEAEAGRRAGAVSLPVATRRSFHVGQEVTR